MDEIVTLEEKGMSQARARLAIRILERVGDPVDLSDPEKMTVDEARLVAEYLFGVDRGRARFMVAVIRGELSGDIAERAEGVGEEEEGGREEE